MLRLALASMLTLLAACTAKEPPLMIDSSDQQSAVAEDDTESKPKAEPERDL